VLFARQNPKYMPINRSKKKKKEQSFFSSFPFPRIRQKDMGTKEQNIHNTLVVQVPMYH
jgi:hypothetical protein